MASISANVSEKVFQIKKWLGVNEAPEGDSRLKYGEAAVMENFRVTAGGALQKRPGTKNVAGLVAAYNVKIDTDTKELLYSGGDTEVVLQLYPRVSVDDTGKLTLDGTPTTVNAVNGPDHVGEFLELPSGVKRLAEVKTVGGGMTTGALTRFSTGTETLDPGASTPTLSGTQTITTYERIANVDGETIVTGETTVRDRGKAPTAADQWLSSGVGGFIRWAGTLYRFEGVYTTAFTETSRMKNTWGRHLVTKKVTTTEGTTTYKEGEWDNPETLTWPDGYSETGKTGYSFSPATGLFTLTGSSKTISATASGTIYQTTNNGKGLYRYIGSASGLTMQYKTRTEIATPGTSETTWSVGDQNATTVTYDDAVPGYSETVTIEGKKYYLSKYTTSGSSTIYYGYTLLSEEPENGYAATYGWYGYPVTLEDGEYEWYFNPVYAETNTTDAAVRGIWSGFVNKREVVCAACNGTLWELIETDGVWSKVNAGNLDTSQNVHMFGFEEKLYILNGSQYLVWDGVTLSEVAGYRPLVAVAVAPAGGGTQLEQINKLSSTRRVWLAPDGSAGTFQLPEKGLASIDYVQDRVSNVPIGTSGYTANLKEGTITFNSAPSKGVNTLEVGYSVTEDYRSEVLGMRFAELYNGAQDSRVFIYGDGSNKALYSDLDYDGQARADYFPDLNVIHVGDANTPLTALIRHYSRLLAFKEDSAYSIYYDTLGLADGSVAAAFYVTPVNRDIGNCAPGQAVLVDNRPRTLDGRSVVEWKATSTSGNISSDTRNGQRISQRVARSIREIDLTTAITFYDKVSHEYYVIGDGGKALVHNVDADAWYVYTQFAATRLVIYKDDLYYGTAQGWLRRVSEDYADDEGEPIPAVWESGSMDFGEDYKRKYSAMLWVGIKPEDSGYLEVTAETDKRSDFAVYPFSSDSLEQLPTMNRIKLKAKKFTYYKLKLSNALAGKTATVVSADIRVRSTGYVR